MPDNWPYSGSTGGQMHSMPSMEFVRDMGQRDGTDPRKPYKGQPGKEYNLSPEENKLMLELLARMLDQQFAPVQQKPAQPSLIKKPPPIGRGVRGADEIIGS